MRERHVFQSMSGKATCLDDASMELFFHIMKVEMTDIHYDKKTDSIQSMTEWIDFYSDRHIKAKLHGKSPIKYRELSVLKAA